VFNKILHKIRNRELIKYIKWKFSYKKLRINIKRGLIYTKNRNLMFNKDPFVKVRSKHGQIVINLNDIYISNSIIENGTWEIDEINFLKELLLQHKNIYGDGVVALDCGANLGVHTLEFSKLMKNWGEVHSFEPQKRVYNALSKTLSLNKTTNVYSYNLALGKEEAFIEVPKLDYTKKLNFGGLELNQHGGVPKIDDQSFEKLATYKVKLRTIDSFNFKRVDLVKIDVEGMELDVLRGGKKMLLNLKPIIFYEVSKSNEIELKKYLELNNYKIIKRINNNSVAIFKDSEITFPG